MIRIWIEHGQLLIDGLDTLFATAPTPVAVVSETPLPQVATVSDTLPVSVTVAADETVTDAETVAADEPVAEPPARKRGRPRKQPQLPIDLPEAPEPVAQDDRPRTELIARIQVLARQLMQKDRQLVIDALKAHGASSLSTLPQSEYPSFLAALEELAI
jgi:hypothetical protein